MGVADHNDTSVEAAEGHSPPAGAAHYMALEAAEVSACRAVSHMPRKKNPDWIFESRGVGIWKEACLRLYFPN